MAERIAFCGVIEGSIVRRPGESETDAIARAERTINDVLLRQCRRLSRVGDETNSGPVVGLEPGP